MGSLDDRMLGADDYLEAQLLTNPVAQEDEEGDDTGRILYRQSLCLSTYVCM